MHRKKPVYLLAGGRARGNITPDPLIQAVFRESGELSPTVAYVGTANGDDIGFFNRIAVLLKETGASRISHAVISPENADIDEAKDILQSAEIIFVSGGDVYRGLQVLIEKDMIHFISELYENGKLFFGISAGSIMLAKEWIHWRRPDNDSTPELFPCLGFAPIICDTHDEQDDWPELKTVLRLEKDNVRGYGIVSGTAIAVFPDGKIESLGGAIHQYIRRSGRVERCSDILPVRNMYES